MQITEQLQLFFKGEVVNDAQTLKLYSSDASAFLITPQVVVFPKDIEDIKALVNFTRASKPSFPELSLTVRSAGTDMTGGPLNDSLIVDVSRHLNYIKTIGEKVVVTEPGVMYRDLEKELLPHRLFFPPYPASKDIASLGGMVANNAGGEKTLRYGKTQDYVQALNVILQDGNEYHFAKLTEGELKEKLSLPTFEGELYRAMYKLIKDHDQIIHYAKPRVSKNSTGYPLWNIWNRKEGTFDLSKLFIGSQGTLGIITEATITLLPVEEHSKTAVIYLQTIEKLAEVVQLILKFHPTSLESYDDNTLKIALRFAPQLARLIGSKTNIVKFAWELLPDLWIILKNGFPKLVIIAEFTGNNEKEIDGTIGALKNTFQTFHLPLHIPKSPEESEKYWIIRRQSFNLLRNKIKNRQTVPFIDDIIVDPKTLPEFLPKLNEILSRYKNLIFTIAGHIGDGNFHIIPLMDMRDSSERALIPELAQKVYQLVLAYDGSLSAEHNDGLIRGPYLKQMYGEKIFSLFRQVKQTFDPLNIFNPHKKTDATLEFSFRYLKTDNEHSV